MRFCDKNLVAILMISTIVVAQDLDYMDAGSNPGTTRSPVETNVVNTKPVEKTATNPTPAEKTDSNPKPAEKTDSNPKPVDKADTKTDPQKIVHKAPGKYRPINCTQEHECRAACGFAAKDTQCDEPTGVCLCINIGGPPRRCRNVRHEDEYCNVLCKRKVAQICVSDFGNFCACFVRNGRHDFEWY